MCSLTLLQPLGWQSKHRQEIRRRSRKRVLPPGWLRTFTDQGWKHFQSNSAIFCPGGVPVPVCVGSDSWAVYTRGHVMLLVCKCQWRVSPDKCDKFKFYSLVNIHRCNIYMYIKYVYFMLFLFTKTLSFSIRTNWCTEPSQQRSLSVLLLITSCTTLQAKV